MTETKGRILIVDDDPEMQGIVADSLQAVGYQTEGAGSGEEALEGLIGNLEDPPGLIITDFEMPGMNGTDLIDELRKAEGLANIPVILLTSYRVEPSVLEALEGVFYLRKPPSLRDLRAAVETGLLQGFRQSNL